MEYLNIVSLAYYGFMSVFTAYINSIENLSFRNILKYFYKIDNCDSKDETRNKDKDKKV